MVGSLTEMVMNEGGHMRIGCVACSLSEAQDIARMGYDYVEIKGDLLVGNDEIFKQTLRILQG